MSERVSVFVYAKDPISQAGIAAQIRGRPELRVLDEQEIDEVEVGLIAADDLDDETIRVMKGMQRNRSPRLVLVLTHIDDGTLLAAVEAGASGFLRRAEATPEALVRAIRAARSGDGTVPPDLLGRLLTQVGRLQRQVLAPRGLLLNGLSEREVEVLKLVAQGMSTGDIAVHLSYSERTIKNVIHDITTRLNLRNRSHAVAFALKEGLI
jgi:DNA-binding NarL/FixJ family response regulator